VWAVSIFKNKTGPMMNATQCGWLESILPGGKGKN
jgi:hypothetical protein